jgi:hypothetical protein
VAERGRDGQLTERDREIVDWVARVGAVGADDVRVAFRTGRTVAYRRLARCVDFGVLGQVRLLYGEPSLYVATPTGLRWVGREVLRPAQLTPGGFAHAQACARLAAAFEGSGRYRVLGERAIRAHERAGGRLIASVAVGPTAGLHHPDLLLEADGARIAVEVELSVKTAQRLRAICRALGRAQHLTAVRYYAAARALGPLDRAVTATRTAHRIELHPLPWAAALELARAA